MVRVKICGITRLEDAQAAIDCGASALGFVFVPSSPRAIAPEQARAIVDRLPPYVESVGVFAGASVDEVARAAAIASVRRVQLHGGTDPAAWTAPVSGYPAITLTEDPASRAALEAALQGGAPAVLVDRPKDASQPPGAEFFARAAALVPRERLILAGGITCENVLVALDCARPFAIDLARGVEESPGKKSPALLAAFFRRVQQWERLA